MTTKKKTNKIDYEFRSKFTDEKLTNMVHLYSAMNSSDALAKLFRKRDVEDIKNIALEIIVEVEDMACNSHFVRARMVGLYWDNRSNGGVVEVKTYVDGEGAETLFDRIYPEKNGNMVYEVIEDVCSALVNALCDTAANVERQY